MKLLRPGVHRFADPKTKRPTVDAAGNSPWLVECVRCGWSVTVRNRRAAFVQQQSHRCPADDAA